MDPAASMRQLIRPIRLPSGGKDKMRIAAKAAMRRAVAAKAARASAPPARPRPAPLRAPPGHRANAKDCLVEYGHMTG